MKAGQAVERLATADIDALTENQRRVLGEISIGNDGGHPENTLLSLVAKGWIVMLPERHSVGLTVYRYEMPIRASMVWCEWCSMNVKEQV